MHERPLTPVLDASLVVDSIMRTDTSNLTWAEVAGFRARHGMPSYEGFLRFLDDSQIEAHRVSNGWLLEKASCQGDFCTEIYRVLGDTWIRIVDRDGYTLRKTLIGPWTDASTRGIIFAYEERDSSYMVP